MICVFVIILFVQLFGMFSDTYRAIKQFVMVNDHWFTEVIIQIILIFYSFMTLYNIIL